MKVRLTHIDGKLPNLALMRLSRAHKAAGDDVFHTRDIMRGLFEPDYDRVYGSSIFSMSATRVALLLQEWPDAVIGGTGTSSPLTIEAVAPPHVEGYDYDVYPDYEYSLGFTQRGCRLKCKFCVVPAKEGKPRSVNTVWDIWRDGSERKLHLLDNDFFGQEHWRERIAEIRDGGFRVCLNQGINVRLIDDEAAEALASIEFRDDQFKRRCLYTAWDNLKDEKIFFRGMDTLERAGIPGKQVMAYMLVGYDPAETWERIMHRLDRMVEREILPYPMVYDPQRRDLKRFQRWVIRRFYEFVPWEEYSGGIRGPVDADPELAL